MRTLGKVRKLGVKVNIKTDVESLPAYQTSGSAGMDLCATVLETINLEPGEFQVVPTGLSMDIPEGYELQIRPRSGLAAKHGITVLNTPGTIDSDYRGEIKVILINLGKSKFDIKNGDRIAQAVLNKVERAQLDKVDVLPSTERGEGGLGHTGV